jgi:GNAT superfamily N-acetyltransferase
MPWKAPEELVLFEPGADKRYFAHVEALRHAGRANKETRPVASGYSAWPHRVGRGKYGEFPLVVVADHYRRLGYTVWFCEPALEQYANPDFVGFMLVSYPGRRDRAHPAYKRMQEVFGEATVAKLNRAADAAKLKMGRRGGGDPDLFVFKGRKRFFVEVKWKDHITDKQRVTFPLIERHCGVRVKIARIVEHRKPSD